MKKILLLYVPVLHKGYLDVFAKYQYKVGGLLLFGDDILGVLLPRREIREIAPPVMCAYIARLQIFHFVRLLSFATLEDELSGKEIIMGSCSLSRAFADRCLRERKVSFEQTFLRHDKDTVFKINPITPDREVTEDEMHRHFMACAATEAQQSPDWWRQVGAILVRDRVIIATGCNMHMPTEHTSYAIGDPRDFIEVGVKPEFAGAIHAEQLVIAEAAKRGITTAGALLYVTCFPCPACAKFIANTGITTLYFRDGSASLDGEKILAAFGVTIVHVSQKETPS